MRLIIKSYLKTFTKNITALLGTLIFIIMLTAIVVGMLATPLQLHTKNNKYASQNIGFDYYKNKYTNFNEDFLYNYILKKDLKRFSESEAGIKLNNELTNPNEATNLINQLFPISQLADPKGWPISKGTDLNIVKQKGLNWLLAKPIFNETGKLEPFEKITDDKDPVFTDETFDSIVGGFEKMFPMPIFTSDFWVQFLITKIEMINIVNTTIEEVNKSPEKQIKEISQEFFTAAFRTIKNSLVQYLDNAFVSYSYGNSIISGVGFAISDYDGKNTETKRWYEKRWEYARDSYKNWLLQEIETKTKPFLDQPDQAKILTELGRILYQANIYLTTNGMPSIQESELLPPIKNKQRIELHNYNWIIKFIKNKIDVLINERFKKIIPNIENIASDSAVIKKHIIYLMPANLLTNEFKKNLANSDQNFDIYTTYYLFDRYNTTVNDEQKIFYESDPHFIYSETQMGSVVPTMTMDIYSANPSLETDFNKIIFDQGREPINENEIVISPAYAKANGLNIGDQIKIPAAPEWSGIPFAAINLDKPNVDEIFLTISGIGIKYDNLSPGKGFSSFIQDYKTYMIGYAHKDLLTKIKETRWNYGTISSQAKNGYIYKIKSKTNPIILFYELNNKKIKTVIDPSTNPFLEWSDSPTAFSINMTKIQIIIFTLLGIVVLTLAFVFINFIIKKEINETRKQLGIFKSFGYKAIELSWIFAIKTLITIFSGIFIGYLFSIPLQQFAATNFEASVTYTFASIYLSPIFILSIGVGLPLVIMFISYALTIYYLTEPTLSLINNVGRIQKRVKYPNSWLIRSLAKRGKGFTYRLQKSFVSRSKGKFIIVQSLFAFSSLLYTLMFGAEALIGQTVNQGFAILKKSTDHRFYWQNRSSYVFNDSNSNKGWEIADEQKYDKTELSYSDYSEYGTANKKLDQEGRIGKHQTVTDSRYTSRLLLSYITHEYNVSEDKISHILPDQIIKELLNPPVLPEKPIGGLKDPKYFLNSILTIRIMNPEVIGNEEKNVKSFQYAVDLLNPASEHYIKNDTDENRIKQAVCTFETTLKYYKKTFKPEDNPTVIYTNEDTEKNPDKFIAQFKQTLFGLTGANEVLIDGIKKDLFNNMFLTDISRILSFELAQEYATSIVRNLKKATPNISIEEVKKQLNANDVLQNFDPENSTYWKMVDNPLLGIMQSNNLDADASDKKRKLNKKADDNPVPSGGLSLAKLSKSAQSIIMTAMMVDSPYYLEDEPVITMNQVFYNQQQEVLMAKFDALIKQNPTDKKMDVEITAVDLKDGYEYGDPRNVLNYNGVSNSVFETMHIVDYQKGTPLNAVVPYALARTLKWNVGDVIDMTSKTSSFTPYQIKIVGINKSMAFNLSLTWPIMVDYDNYAKQTFTDELYKEYEKGHSVQFSVIFSNRQLLDGKVDLKSIGNSISSMKFKGSSLTVAVKKESSVFASIFNSLLNIPSGLLDVDDQIQLVTNPNIGAVSKKAGVEPYNIILVTVNDLTAKFSTIMLIFLLLQTFLLAIILIIVMSIVIDEAAKIILTMRALGYKTHEINWVVMGRYVIWAFIFFIIAYGFSMLIWEIALLIVADQLQIYIFLPFDWKALVVTFLVLGAVLLIGWYTSYKQVNRRKLPEITNVN